MTKSKRIAAIDWMRGFVMMLMVIDHVSMAYNAQHNSSDSAAILFQVIIDCLHG